MSQHLYPVPQRQVGPEVGKTLLYRIDSGFVARYLSRANILDIGFRGEIPTALPIVPQAIGVELDYPGYDGKTLPFPDQSQDAVHASHCLEHIPDPARALGEWFRVLRIGGYLVLTVPHQQLYERKPVPTSRWGGNDHLRFYTPASFLTEIENALPLGEFRIRLLRDNDTGFDYTQPPDQPPTGCYEIELVIERIAKPIYAEALRLSDQARAIIESYRQLIETLLRLDATGKVIDVAALQAYGRMFPIPPYRVLRAMFSTVPEEKLCDVVRPLIDPSVVDAEWYTRVHPDVQREIGPDIGLAPEHYRRSGYFECKLPSMHVGLYG
jgi:SAM-dependent methyltransferase